MNGEPAGVDARFENVRKSATFRNLIGTYELDKSSVLDIGCCYGEHVRCFGPGSTGITIDPEEARIGSGRGLDVRQGNAEDTLPIDRTYDAIYSNNLLEHVYSPHAFLHTLREAVRPGGLLILGVPVIPLPRALMRLRKFRGALADAHINFFTQASLRYTVERAGWNVESVRGFHFNFAPIDTLVLPLYPHVYVVARVNPEFRYSQKRLKELAGYKTY